jgi:hypothetical protein
MAAFSGKPSHVAIAALVLIPLFACDSSKETDSQAARQEIARLKSEVERLENRQSFVTKLANKGQPGVWELGWNDTAEIFESRLLKRYSPDQSTPNNIVNGLNRFRPVPGVEFVEQRGATVYLRIKDSEMLTHRMGSTGAREYLGTVTISLTSSPGVELVHFDFFEGDHASPGFYSRAAFIGSS